MTTAVIPGTEVAERISSAFPDAIIESTHYSVTVKPDQLADVARFLRDDEELDCKYLNTLLGIDWLEHFNLVYVLSSLAKNHTLVLEARSYAHEDPVVPSVSSIWVGAHLQEREVYDLMGIGFIGHPDLKRIFLWEGFPGHPLRKDFLALPDGHKPGLQRFPFEFPSGERGYPNLAAQGGPRAPSVPRLVQSLPGQTEAQDLAGGQLGVRGGGSTETRAPLTRLPQLPVNPEPGRTSEGGSTPAEDETAASAEERPHPDPLLEGEGESRKASSEEEGETPEDKEEQA
jgi:NADH-quinone oxidoreductase subunit C